MSFYINDSWNKASNITHSIGNDEWNTIYSNKKEMRDYMKNTLSSDVNISTISEDKTTDYGNITLTTSQNLIDELIQLKPEGSFVPYTMYNKHNDSIKVYFKDSDYYCQPLNENIQLLLSHENNDIVGVTILNVKNIILG